MGEGISVLLLRRKKDPSAGKWALPGGYVDVKESLEEAVLRKLEEKTSIRISYLEQLYTFGDPKRNPLKKVVTIAYYGLVRTDIFAGHLSGEEQGVKWFNIAGLPKLAFDHKNIIETAITRLRNKISYEPIGFELLDKTFQFSELHTLYETLYGKDIDRRNFKKKFLGLGILKELKEKNVGAKGRPGNLYQFEKEKYFKLKEKGMIFEV